MDGCGGDCAAERHSMTEATGVTQGTMSDVQPEADEATVEARVKGTKLKSKLAFVEEAFGGGVLQEVLSALPEEDQQSLRRLLDLGWYPIGIFDRLLAAIVQVAGRGDLDVLDRMGRESANYQAENAYRVYFRGRDPRALLEAMVPMHSQINKPARMELVERGERSLSLVVYGPPTTLLTCRLARSFYQRAMELAGGESARVTESACMARGQDHCRFDMEW